MKKLLLGITGVSLLLIFVLVSCGESGTADVTSKVELQTLAAPTNVKATAFGKTGVIHVTWEPVVNAKAYDVYRKSAAPANQGGETLFVYKATVNAAATTNGGYVGYEDIISTTNEFKPDVTYTYKIVAISDWSSYNKTTAATDRWNPTADLALQNSSANSNSVKFAAPSTDPKKAPKDPLSPVGTKLDTPEITLDTVKAYGTTTVDEFLQVSWDVSPGVKYIVYYSYGSDDLIIKTNFYNQPAIVAGQTKAVSRFPLINGKTNVQLVAQQNIPTTTPPTIPYYQDSDPAVKNYEGAKTILPNSSFGFTATPADHMVALVWTDYPGAVYTVKRFTGKTAGYATGGGYIFDDWTDITDKINAVKTVTQWNAYDKDLNDQDQGYVYMLIATLGDAQSIPVTAEAGRPISAPDLATSSSALGWNSEKKEYNGIQLAWTPKLGQTYKLYRKAVACDINDAGTTVTIIGPKTGTWEEGWTEVTGFSAVPNNDGAKYAVIDKPQIKDAYRYKLEATEGSLKAESYFDVKAAPYLNVVNIGVIPSNIPAVTPNTAAETTAGWTPTKDRGAAYTIGLTLNTTIQTKDEIKVLVGSDTVEIYRAKTSSSGTEEGPYQKVTFDQVAFLAEKEVIDKALEPGYYKYKAVVVSGTTQIRNLSPNTTAVATSYNVPSFTMAADRKLIVTSTGNYFDKLQVYFRHVEVAGDASGTEINAALESSYTELPGTLARSSTTDVAKKDEYTSGITVPAASTGTTKKYYEVWVRNGNGNLDKIVSATAIP
jgi:hypothetical protein